MVKAPCIRTCHSVSEPSGFKNPHTSDHSPDGGIGKLVFVNAASILLMGRGSLPDWRRQAAPLKSPATMSTCSCNITVRTVSINFFPITRFLASWLLLCDDIMVTKIFCQLPVHLGHLLWHVFLKESHVNVHLTLYLGHPLVHTVMEFPAISAPSLLHRFGDNKARFSEAEAKSLSRSPSQPRDRYRIKRWDQTMLFPTSFSPDFSGHRKQQKDDWMRGKQNQTNQTHTKKNRTLLQSSVRLESINIRANITDDKNKKKLEMVHQNRFNVWEMYCSVRFASTLTQHKCFGESVTNAGTRYDWRLIKSDTTRDQGERWKTGELCAMCWHSPSTLMSLWNQGVAFLYSLCCRPFFSETPSSQKFCDFLRMRTLHRSSHSVAFLCTDPRRAAHRMPHAYIASHPSVSFTSFAAHVKHHVLSDLIPFPFGLYVCLLLSCLDVKCTLDMNPLSPPASSLPPNFSSSASSKVMKYCPAAAIFTIPALEHSLINWKWSGRFANFRFIVQQVSLQSLIGPRRFVRCRQICWHHHGLWIVFSNKSPCTF